MVGLWKASLPVKIWLADGSSVAESAKLAKLGSSVEDSMLDSEDSSFEETCRFLALRRLCDRELLKLRRGLPSRIIADIALGLSWLPLP